MGDKFEEELKIVSRNIVKALVVMTFGIVLGISVVYLTS